jgi:hypothetical protein
MAISKPLFGQLEEKEKSVKEFHKTLVMTGVSFLLVFNAQGETAADLEQLMTPEQYRAAGLEKLSNAERQALYQWLRTYTEKQPLNAPPAPAAPIATVASQPAVGSVGQQNPAPVPASLANNFGFPEPLPDTSSESSKLNAKVLGNFRGWSGKTLFTLDNGQVWKQRSAGRYTYLGNDTRVMISRNHLGLYELRLIAADRSVGVSRVK